MRAVAIITVAICYHLDLFFNHVCCCNQPNIEQLEVQPGMEAGFDNPMYGTGALQEVRSVFASFSSKAIAGLMHVLTKYR